MAIFSNKIVDVYYTDENLSNVTILYNYEKDGETLVGEYHLLVDETEAQFQDLMKEVTYQDIELATLEMHKTYRNQLQALVDEEVKKYQHNKYYLTILNQPMNIIKQFLSMIQIKMQMNFLSARCICLP